MIVCLELGVTGAPKCPYCGNSSQNAKVAMSAPGTMCCANCKAHWIFGAKSARARAVKEWMKRHGVIIEQIVEPNGRWVYRGLPKNLAYILKHVNYASKFEAFKYLIEILVALNKECKLPRIQS